MKNKKRFLYVTMLVGILATVVVAGTAFAQTATPSNGQPHNTIISRVATILGVDQAKVQSAFDQAQKEAHDEALNQRLSQLVQNGKLTQAQADQYKAWLAARPATAVSQEFQAWLNQRPNIPGVGLPGLGGPGFGPG